MTDSYHAFFHIETVPDRFVERAIEQCVECGFDTVKAGGSEYIQQYETAAHDRMRDADDPDDDYTGGSISDIAEEISEAEEGTVTLWYDTMEFELLFYVQPGQEWYIPKVELTFWRRNVTPDDHRTRESAQNRIDHVVKAITKLTTAFDPEFAYCDTLDVLEHVFPEERPIVDQIERIPWATVLSGQLVEEFGGYERVLATPAWQVDELESGHVLIVRTDNTAVPAAGAGISLEEYLLEGKSLKELKDEN